ncbi:MAG: hypothetical protein IT249_10210 [Chitinophagaceae bacterium]|nr:hypothetical protein [Chitinophagaceae bacterium]
MQHITTYSIITGNIASKDGTVLFEKLSLSPQDFFLALYKHLQTDYPKFYKMDNLCKLGFLTTEILLEGRNIHEAYGRTKTGIVLSNANASLDADIAYFETVKNIPSPAQFVYTLPNIVIGEISIRHGFKGENAFFVSEEFDAGLLEFYVSDLFKRKSIDCCIAGWVDFLGESYRAVLYLVENRSAARSLPWTTEHINKIYELANGKING